MLIGYARVSTSEQETTLQIDALRRAGVRTIFQEKRSAVSVRPQLTACVQSLRRGDVLVVYKLDRIARSLKDLLLLLETLSARGSGFRSITEPIDTSTSIGLFIVQILGAVAQFERTLIRERTIAGQVAAYERGVRWGGRRRILNEDEADAVRVLHASGWYTMETLGLIFGVSRSSVSRILSPGPGSTYRPIPVLSQYLQAPA